MGNAESSNGNDSGDENRDTPSRASVAAAPAAGVAVASVAFMGARRLLSSSGSEEESPVAALPLEQPQVRVYWSPPPLDWYKVNTDASILPVGSGIGYIIRDHDGEMIHAEATRIEPTDDIAHAEAEAIVHGLRKAKELGMIRKVILETDQESNVMKVNGEAKPKMKNREIFRRIQDLISSFDDYKIKHVQREANRCANHLAREAAKGNPWPSADPSVRRRVSLSLQKQLEEDKEGAGL